MADAGKMKLPCYSEASRWIALRSSAASAAVVLGQLHERIRLRTEPSAHLVYAARLNAGAASLSGGTAMTSILEVVSPRRRQLGQ